MKSVPSRNNAEMSFREIGQAMGITGGGAWMLYQNALRKLRKRPGRLERLRELALEAERIRERRLKGR